MSIWQDVPYVLRTLRRDPLFAAAAVLTLALGIGGNTAMFTVVRAVLLKPLPYRDPTRLVRVTLHSVDACDGKVPVSNQPHGSSYIRRGRCTVYRRCPGSQLHSGAESHGGRSDARVASLSVAEIASSGSRF